MLSNLVFILKTFYIIGEYYILYFFAYDKKLRFENAVKQLNSLNMFYVKAFQAISTNSYLLTNDQISYLSSYTDNVPFHSNEIDPTFENHIRRVAKQLGDNFVINKQGECLYPIKSGMVALVYSGTLNGKPVAIKVLRKNIRERMEDALNKIDFLGQIIGRFPYIRAFNVNELISENREIMIAQTDLQQEVDNMNIMYKNCIHTDYVTIPKSYPEYSSHDSSFFVMDYIKGNKLSEIEDIDKETYCLQLAKFGIKCILYNRVYHGDLHPGNILFIKDINGDLRLGIIDFGIMGTLSREEQDYYYKILMAMNESENCDELVRLILSRLVEPRDKLASLTPDKHNKIVCDLALIFHNILSVNRNIEPAVLYDINKVLRDNGLYLSKSFCKIQLCMSVCDSVISKLSIGATYLDNIKRIVSEMNVPL
jgi:predicted unusual protein kinase regulating ubiquinone biosynthesis (AarF/ABC1/UbiB family)